MITKNEFVCLKSNILAFVYPKQTSSWIVASECTAHICFDKSLFELYEPMKSMKVGMDIKAVAVVAGRETSSLKMQYNKEFIYRKLEDVLHVLLFEYSLLSVSSIY